MALSREQILQADDLKIERVPVPEWSGEVLLRTMSGHERTQFEERIVIERDGETVVDKRRFFAQLLAATMIDEEGALLFSTPDEVQQLMAKNGAALMRLGARATKLNGLSAQDQEDLLKNSAPVPNGASSSDSPSR